MQAGDTRRRAVLAEAGIVDLTLRIIARRPAGCA